MDIRIEMTPADFDQLIGSTSPWAGKMTIWQNVLGCFEPCDPGKDLATDEPARHWVWVHFIGHEYTALLLARAFLASLGHPYEVVYNTASSSSQGGPLVGWCLLTDYTPVKPSPVPPM